MSKLSDFFPGGSPETQGTNITVIMVGGGGGAGTCGGAGGGGYFYGSFRITPGVSYPVTIGTGGSPGNPSLANTSDGLGNPGSPSKFGKYEALGGCGGSTFSSTTFGIPGGAGGSGGGNQASIDSTTPCPNSGNSSLGYLQTGSSQRILSPTAYCGALGSRTLGSPMGGGYCNLFDSSNSNRRCTGTVVCPEFFGVCLASVPYTYSPAPTIPTIIPPGFVTCLRAGCVRSSCGAPFRSPAFSPLPPTPPSLTTNCVIGNCPNTGFGALCPACNGDSGVVLVAYPCTIPAATSYPGAVDCSPISIPQNNFRTYKFTSSGSFTL